MCIMAVIRIDKSRFTPEEMAQYQALLAKASVDPEGNQDEAEEDLPPVPAREPAEAPEPEPEAEMAEEEEVETEKCSNRTRKSADPALAAALTRLEALEKSAELEKLTGIAKKYEPLGEDTAELAQTLYDLSKSDNPANYDAYIKVLDKSLDLVNKTGIFAEIGKSSRGDDAGSVEAKIEAAASDIQKSDPTLDRTQAIAKAWEAHPELVAEYEQEYRQ